MSCTCAPTLRQARIELDRLHPDRSRASDGCCASPQHTEQNPDSGHERGDALDATQDPAHNVDCDDLVALVVARRDPRIRLIIWDRRIWRAYDKTHTDAEIRKYHFPRRFVPAWEPEPYYGPNPHTKHGHFEIYAWARHDVRPWWNSHGAPVPMSYPSRSVEVDHMRLVTELRPIIFDGDGNGWIDTDGIPWDHVVSVTPHGPNPEEQGYLPIARIGMQERNGVARVVLEGSWPRGGSAVVVKFYRA